MILIDFFKDKNTKKNINFLLLRVLASELSSKE